MTVSNLKFFLRGDRKTLVFQFLSSYF